MSPGPLTSQHRGGLHFQHGARERFAPTPTHRTYFDQRQRFAVAPNAAGGSTISLTEDETVSVGTGEDGSVTIEINPKPDNGNGGNGLANGNGKTLRRSFEPIGRLARRAVNKMALAANSDGSITVRPEGDAVLQVVGDPLSGAITIVELEPEPLNGPSGQ